MKTVLERASKAAGEIAHRDRPPGVFGRDRDSLAVLLALDPVSFVHGAIFALQLPVPVHLVCVCVRARAQQHR